MIDKLASFAAATNAEYYDPNFRGGEWMVDAVETHETLDQFIESSKNWAERSAPTRGEIAGCPFVAWSRVQAVRGLPRRAMTVIDFGEIRYAIDADLSAL